MTAALSPSEFPDFFRAVHQREPFPWQARLARQVFGQRGWPPVLDLPTGAGKTAALDIALFHLAITAADPARAAPMRIAFIVDRRLVVDEAFDRATRIAAALQAPAAAITRRVAAALQQVAGGGPPLVVARLRGGVPREDEWARTPCQPTILCSTVDQTGSRLMFRGYGVSDRMAPIHAGLLGSDALILLDEAHLSEPFRQTLLALSPPGRLRGPDTAPFATALLSATPGAQMDGEPFRLDAADRNDPILSARLRATKPAQFRDGADKDPERGDALAAGAREVAARLRQIGHSAPIVGVVANRVARARSAYTALLADHPAILVIGRSRPIDRDTVAAELAPYKTGQPRPDTPMFIIGTQAIEAGIDIDLDALVTEAAPIDSLRQRFGRVDRAGRGAGAVSIVVGSRRARDQVYGEATAATIAALWPNAETTVDFGSDAMAARLSGTDLAPLIAPRPDAPILMPAYISLWAQTAPRPSADPEPALFLHGAAREPASVQLVWRDDVDLRRDPQLLHDLLSITPPRAHEVLELPMWAARQWLQGAAPDLADIAEPARDPAPGTNRRAFRWAGADDPRSALVGARDVRPGDLLVVPASHGGCDRYGWAPGDSTPVRDVFEDVPTGAARQPDVIRIKPGTAPGIPAALAALGDAPRGRDVISAIADLLPVDMQDRLNQLAGQTVQAHFPYAGTQEGRPGVILVASARGFANTGDGATGDDAASLHSNTPQTLRRHTALVEHAVAQFAAGMALPPAIVQDLFLAARLHDVGKTDLRFQSLLSGAGPFAPLSAEPLAKSAKGAASIGGWARARLPDRWRHEALSVRIAAACPLITQAHDRALVLYLIGVHHGFGRPFFPHGADDHARPLLPLDGVSPAWLDAGPGPQSLDFVLDGDAWGPAANDPTDLRGLDWFTMIRDLHGRYGVWGLARLESALRLADHRASADGDAAP